MIFILFKRKTLTGDWFCLESLHFPFSYYTNQFEYASGIHFDRLCKKVTLIFCGKSLFHFKFWFRFRFVFIAWKQRHLSALNISSIMRKKKNISHVKTCYKLRLKGSRFLTFVKIWTVLSKNGDLVMSFLCIIIYSVKRLG